jgi:hypothetical protein
MRRILILSITCVVLLVVTVGASFLISSSVHAGNTSTQAGTNSVSRIQMLSGTFIQQAINPDGQPVTLIALPFSIATTGKLEATSLITGIASGITVTCDLNLDNVAFFSTTWMFNPNGGAIVQLGGSSVMTHIAAGKHTFTVTCTNTGPNNSVEVFSDGTSLIVTN